MVLVHARLIGQGGIFFTQQTWQPPELLHGVTQGSVFSPPAAVAAQMQNAILITDAREILSGHAVNALRVSSVFEQHRRLFLPIMMLCLVVAMVVAGYRRDEHLLLQGLAEHDGHLCLAVHAAGDVHHGAQDHQQPVEGRAAALRGADAGRRR